MTTNHSVQNLEETEERHNGKTIYRETVESDHRNTRPVVKRRCDYCGKNYLSRVSSLKSGKGLFCSRSCASKNTHESRDLTSNNNPNYKGKKEHVDDLKNNASCDCGENRAAALCFHHLDPKEKTDNVSRMACKAKYDIDDLKSEVDKCEILCLNCHKMKHAKNNETDEGAIPGYELPEKQYIDTLEGYEGKKVYKNKETYRRCIIRDCDYCSQQYFAKISQLKIGKGRYHCQGCSSKDAWKKRDYQSKEDIVREYKETGCNGCGEERKSCLECHHISNNKNDEISNMVQYSATKKELKKELEKCVVLCANCHSYRHSNAGKVAN